RAASTRGANIAATSAVATIAIGIGARAIADDVARGHALAGAILAHGVAQVRAGISAASTIARIRIGIRTISAAVRFLAWALTGATLAGHTIGATALVTVVTNGRRIHTDTVAADFAKLA
ncbi:MAG TPA: hypothetical protein VN938_00235, partial [Xanthobacteraceae bacterium]|nr:hypothetical protein [Xanthobacteraceae bacterium]